MNKVWIHQGFRNNVGLVILNSKNQVFWGARIHYLDSWQFPQGGIEQNETAQEALYRELKEEVGLSRESVKYLGESRAWFRYRFPKSMRDANGKICYGQQQKWFLLQFIGNDEEINLNNTQHPEFREWRWVDYWYPISHVVAFKRRVYKKVLREFAEIIRD